MSLSLVTGAPGWLGTNLVHALAAGLAEHPALGPTPRTTRCLVQPGIDASALEALGVEIVRGDITSPASLRPFFAGARDATVFHAAGTVHPAKGTRQFHEVNVTGTANLLAAAGAARIRRFIHVSSNSPIGCNATRDGLFDEAAPYHPYLGYGRSKMLAEMAVRAARDFEWVIVRPPWFYGPCQPPRQSLFFALIRDGKVPIVGDGGNRRSLAYVDNICQGLLLADRIAGAGGQVYWIADRRPYPMNEIIATIAQLLEEDFGITVVHKARRLPAFAGDVAFGIDWAAQGLGLYFQKIHVLGEMGRTIACSVAKAERELGYAPAVGLREGMRRSIAWALEHNLLSRS